MKATGFLNGWLIEPAVLSATFFRYLAKQASRPPGRLLIFGHGQDHKEIDQKLAPSCYRGSRTRNPQASHRDAADVGDNLDDTFK